MPQTKPRARRAESLAEHKEQGDQDDGKATGAAWFATIAFKWLIAYLDALASLDARGEPLPATAIEASRLVTLHGIETVRLTQILRAWGVVDAETQRVDEEELRLLVRSETRSAALRRYGQRQYGADFELLVDPHMTRPSLTHTMRQRWRTSEEMLRRGVRFMIALAIAAELPVAPGLVEHQDGRLRRSVSASLAVEPNGQTPPLGERQRDGVRALHTDAAFPSSLRDALASDGIRVVNAGRHTGHTTVAGESASAAAATAPQNVLTTGADALRPDQHNGHHYVSSLDSHEPGNLRGSPSSMDHLRNGPPLAPEAEALLRRFMAIVTRFPDQEWPSPDACESWLDQALQLYNAMGNLARLMPVRAMSMPRLMDE